MTSEADGSSKLIDTGAYSGAMAEKGDTALSEKNSDEAAKQLSDVGADGPERGAADEQATKAPRSM